MTGAKKLVIAASGFLGSDVTRQLFDRGDVFYCVVDTRAWLRDPAPLFRTNVEGLRHVLEAAVDADLRSFVFTSTIGTIGMPADRRPATEEDEFNWADKAGAYVRSRVEAENM